jgi:replication-associated recombination protein RarA
MQPLFEKYRPRSLEEVVGQDKAVGQVRTAIARGVGGRAFWLSGASGTGKTTLAKIIAGTIAEEWVTAEYDSADALTLAELADIERAMGLFGPGRGGRAYIVNEAHGLRDSAIRKLLGMLERIPAHVVWVFTTTKDGQEALFGDAIDASPLLSRCFPIALTNQGLAKAFAERVRTCAQAEGLDGLPVEHYIRLAQKCKNNARAMFQAVEAGGVA